MTIHLAFLGCGNVTRAHSRTLRRSDEVRRYYASRDRGVAEDASRRFGGAGAFGSYREALEDSRIEAVLVATPPDSHLELTLEALARGKHVIVEKPAFLRSADFVPVRAAAERAGRRVLVAENYAYKPLARAIQRIVASGTLGEIRFVNLVAVKQQRSGGWKDDAAIAGGGALFEGGVHWVDLFAHLGLVVESVHGFRPEPGEGLERSMAVVARFAGGGIGTLYHSWEIPSPLRGLRISRIYGTRGSLAFESNGLVVAVTSPRPRLIFPGIRDISGYRAMFHDFFECIGSGREPRMTLARAQHGIELIESAYANARATTLEEVR
ncbi:MAG: Gfo/Idh/MocA family oxidoreductase [Gemmatimonadales bacterium]|nr:Gfo/Idh/MocA family oxidoreductase [Gemmatimonadales bacterium]